NRYGNAMIDGPVGQAFLPANARKGQLRRIGRQECLPHGAIAIGLLLVPAMVFAAELVAPSVTVGQNLETTARIGLKDPAPKGGFRSTSPATIQASCCFRRLRKQRA